MTIRSKQWYTNTSRLPNSFVNVSIGRPSWIKSRQQDHRSDGRWSQNFKYVWLDFAAKFVLISNVNPLWTNVVIAQPPCEAQAGEANSRQKAGQYPTLPTM